MSKKQIMKEILDEKINKDRIYRNVLFKVEEESGMNKMRNKKIIYTLTSGVAVFSLFIVICISYNKPNINKISKSNVSQIQDVENEDHIIFNNKSIKNVLDVDGNWRDENIEEKFGFIKNIDVLKQYEHLRQGIVYVKENIEDTDYSKLQQYQLIYYMDGNNAPSTEIVFTKENKILTCMLPEENDFTNSNISGNKVKLFKTEHFEDKSKINGEAFFEHDGYKFYIESQRIDENDFINIVKAILAQSIVNI